MGHNVLSAEKRLQLQLWLKQVNKSGNMLLANIADFCKQATSDLQFPISPSHIRKNAKLLNIRLPREHNTRNNTAQIPRKSFTCKCGQRYSVGIYAVKGGNNE